MMKNDIKLYGALILICISALGFSFRNNIADIFSLLTGFAAISILYKEIRRKLGNKKLIQKISKLITSLLSLFFKLFEFKTNSDKTFYLKIKGKNKYSFIGKDKLKHENLIMKLNRTKWDEKNSNSQKVRWFYKKHILKLVKKQIKIQSKTPNELLDNKDAFCKLLLENYNLARYDKAPIISDDIIEKLKGTYSIK